MLTVIFFTLVCLKIKFKMVADPPYLICLKALLVTASGVAKYRDLYNINYYGTNLVSANRYGTNPPFPPLGRAYGRFKIFIVFIKNRIATFFIVYLSPLTRRKCFQV